YQERYDVIQYYSTHGMAATLSKFYTNLSTTSRETQRKKIYQWLAKKDHIAGLVSTTGTAKQRSWRRLGACTTLSHETEDMLVRWVHDMRKDGVPHPLFLILRTSKSKVKAVVQENLAVPQGFGKRLWESVEPMEAKFNCRVYGNPTAWWNGSISLSFLEFHFSERPDLDTKPVLFVWDDFSAHWTEEVVAYATSINVVLVRIPPRVADPTKCSISLIQAAHQYDRLAGWRVPHLP
ncbi:hypothetical protein DYB37_010743, partial [Aphanomyces astaci]